MAEYVYEVVTEHELCRDVHHYVRRERVVRCRDCIHFRPSKPKTSAPSRCSGVFAFVHSDPDGFCAWGMARKRGDRK